MKNVLSLLVVEDQQHYLEEVRKLLTSEQLPVVLQVRYATDLEEALQLLPDSDMVMTDVFFPSSRGGEEQPNGKRIVEECLKTDKPVVWVTSTWHHGKKTNPLSEWGRSKGLEMFDALQSGERLKDSEGEASHKPWKRAIYGVISLLLRQEFQLITITEDGINVAAPYPEEDGEEQDAWRRQRRFAQNLPDWVRFFMFVDQEQREYLVAQDPVAAEMIQLGFRGEEFAN